jgi:ferredoxin--NADP+ reductase
MVLIGGGTGLAPFVSYSLHLRAIGNKREIVVLHGASYVDELGYRDQQAAGVVQQIVERTEGQS